MTLIPKIETLDHVNTVVRRRRQFIDPVKRLQALVACRAQLEVLSDAKRITREEKFAANRRLLPAIVETRIACRRNGSGRQTPTTPTS